jgi:regulator of protease activity HflC (stomatin/prohibitin superfamily)
METLLGTLAGIVFVLGVAGLKIDREYERGVIFRLGRLSGVKGPGMYWIIPGIDQKAQVDVRTKTVDIMPQETVTADSVTIKVNAVLYYRILDPAKAINKVENYQMAVYQAAMTTLRNVVGQNILDDVLQNRDKINHKVQEIVDEMTEPWGVVIERVEIKDVEIPTSMQRAMAKEAEAVREKRARLIKASAEQEASIKLAEASQKIVENPAALELRRLQMLTEIGAENNTTTLIMMPSDFITLAKQWTDVLQNPTKATHPTPQNGAASVVPTEENVPTSPSSTAKLEPSRVEPFAAPINPAAEPLPPVASDWKMSDQESL